MNSRLANSHSVTGRQGFGTKGSRKNSFTFLTPMHPKGKRVLFAFAKFSSHLTALRKLGICPIFLRFLALSAGRLNATHL